MQEAALTLAITEIAREEVVLWQPQPGPQTEALNCEADELLYGGEAGGGKTDLLIGLAITQHGKAAIFRREYENLKEIEERAHEIIGDNARYNGQRKMWKFPNGNRLDFGAVQHEKDKVKWKGRPHDLKAFDELSEFTESQYLFITGWTRSVDPNQRCRIVSGSNPPTTAAGEWMTRRWGAWLDRNHPNPAMPGEIRWYARLDDKDTEVENGDEFEYKGEIIKPLSRTFIPAGLDDNAYLRDSNYRAILQFLPEPLRSQLLYGDFTAGIMDDPWQLIPTEWVDAAIERGKQRLDPDMPLTQVGNDVAYTGKDKTVLAKRYGNWLAPIETHEKINTTATADHVEKALWDNTAVAVIDTTGGYGAGVYDQAKLKPQVRSRVLGFNFSGGAKRKIRGKMEPITDRTGRLTFVNNRAWMWYNMKEVLDPETGDDVALPDDPELRADLTAPHWFPRSNGIQIESKDAIHTRLGRSPDKGDGTCLAFLPLRAASLPDKQPEQKSKYTKPREGGSRWKGRFEG